MPEEFENGGFILKWHQMFFRPLDNNQQSFWIQLRLNKTRPGWWGDDFDRDGDAASS